MKKGFTLIEMIIGIVILSIVSIFSFSFLASSVQTYQIMNTQRELHQEAAYILERISRELRDGNLNIGFGTFLLFTKSHGTPVDNSTVITFNKVGSDLYRNSSLANKLIGRYVTNFNVTYNSNTSGDLEDDTFTINIELAKDGQRVTLNTTICPKNYCSWGPFSIFCFNNYNGRSFNRDYEDVVN